MRGLLERAKAGAGFGTDSSRLNHGLGSVFYLYNH